MLTSCDMATTLLRQHMTLAQFLSPLDSISEVSWHILLQIYVTPAKEGCEISSLAQSLDMEEPTTARYINVLCNTNYIERLSIEGNRVRLYDSTRETMDYLLRGMAHELASFVTD